MPPKKKPEEQEQDERDEVVAQLVDAHTIAKTVFPDAKDQTFATFEIFELLDNADSEEELARDLHAAKDAAKVVFETETPTPEQVIGIFDEFFDRN